MPYNPKIHHRRSIRLKGYDYSKAGLYFITICCQDRICRFGNVVNGEMILNELGDIAYNEWANLINRFSNFELDVFQIMPNHIHGIIALKNLESTPVGATLAVAQKEKENITENEIENEKENEKEIENENITENEKIIEGQPQGIAPTRIAPTGITPQIPLQYQILLEHINHWLPMAV